MKSEIEAEIDRLKARSGGMLAFFSFDMTANESTVCVYPPENANVTPEMSHRFDVLVSEIADLLRKSRDDPP